MKIEQSLNTSFQQSSVVTIGTFDGVHIGHQKIIKRLVNLAKEKNLQAVVLTFFPHPRMVLQKDADIKLINTIDEKALLLEKFGIDQLVVKKFTQEFSRLTALEFVRDILVNKLKTKHIIIGYDHHFGRNRNANIKDLQEFGETYEFEVIEISAQEIDEVAVSSTKIRKALSEGDLEMANTYLGYNFMLTGLVVKGNGLGKQIEFPTANLSIEESYKFIPQNGVYVVEAHHDNRTLYGMMNIGMKPTVSQNNERSIEVHFFNFEQTLYGKKLQIDVLKRLRDEQKFESINLLKQQLFQDKEHALAYLRMTNAE